MRNLGGQRGISILGAVILFVIILVILGYFDISVKSVVEKPETQENLNYVRGGVMGIWDKYLAKPASYLWNDVWLPYFWRPFIDNMGRIRDKMPTDYDLNAPTVNAP